MPNFRNPFCGCYEDFTKPRTFNEMLSASLEKVKKDMWENIFDMNTTPFFDSCFRKETKKLKELEETND